MRPENLKIPSAWDKLHPYIEDRVWYIPKSSTNLDTYQFPGWSDPHFFGNEASVHVEYCSGNGVWIATKALEFPNINWVAVEKKFDRVKKIWSKIKNHDLNNLIVIYGEGYQTTKAFFADQCISKIYINFPDPWPKKRHFKHRLIQNEFLYEIKRTLKNQSEFVFVTDDPPYSEWLLNLISEFPALVNLHPEPFFVTEFEGYGTSYFDELWREKGREIRYHQFIKHER